jgi:hypothetical protein
MRHRIGMGILADNEDMYEHLIEVEYGVLEIEMVMKIDTDIYVL